jgi:putative MFS transporter
MIGASLFLDGFDIYLASGVRGAPVKSGQSTLTYNAFSFLSASFGGMMVGSWMAGILGDRFGQRCTYQANLLIFGIASLFGAATPSMSWLIVARFFIGLGIRTEVFDGYSMLNDFVPREHRGRWGSSLVTITNSSFFVFALAGYLIIPNVDWRWMFVIFGVGAFFIAYLYKEMPESLRWLEAQCRLAKTEIVGLGSRLCTAMCSLITRTKAGTRRNTPRRGGGVKCTVIRPFREPPRDLRLLVVGRYRRSNAALCLWAQSGTRS